MAASQPPTSRSTSALASSLPWLYPYREDAQSTRLDGPVFRPFVPISLVYGEQSTWQLTGLVDTGADAILASDLLADQLGVNLDDHEGETSHAVGGRIAIARYKTIALRLHPPDAEQREYVKWKARVGFVGVGIAMASPCSAASAFSTASLLPQAVSPRPSRLRTATPSTNASASSTPPDLSASPAACATTPHQPQARRDPEPVTSPCVLGWRAPGQAGQGRRKLE